MSTKLQTVTRSLKLRELERLTEGEDNARYMTPAQYERLVTNLRSDGVLTSAPLVYRGKVLSGNHRVAAAIDAGIEESDCIVILSELSEGQQLALQLAHNSVTGQDDPNVLKRLYDALDLDGKAYSGLTDDAFKWDNSINLSALAAPQPQYTELVAMFLPEEHAEFDAALKRCQHSETATRIAARYADFDTVFDALCQTKERQNIANTAVALAAMAQLAIERLAQLRQSEPPQDSQDQQPQQPAQ